MLNDNPNRYPSRSDLWAAVNERQITLSYSGLKSLSNGNFTAFIDYYTTNKSKKTPALLFGEMFHALILEPDKFNNTYKIAPDDFKTQGTNKWLDLEKETKKTLILPNSMQQLRVMEAALKKSKNPVIQSLFSNTTAKELPFEVLLNGWKFKGFFDAVGSCGVVDIKTVSDIDKLHRNIYDFDYHLQAYIYLQAAKILRPNLPTPTYYLVFITIAGAYRVVQLSDKLIGEGKDLFNSLLAHLNSWDLDNDYADEFMDKTIII